MKEETIDILLATCNGFSFIASQLDSILSQTHKQIRLIIRDDVSDDSTRKILETYAQRFPEVITLVPADVRLGINGNFSCLMEHSTAHYIMFADQDDLWDHSKVSKTLKKMQELENLYSVNNPLLVHTDLKVVDRDLNDLSPSFWQYSGINPFYAQTLNRLLMQNVVTGCAMMINRPLLQLAHPIPENAAMHDWWIALVASAFGYIEALPYPTLLYRQHGKNKLGAQKFISWNSFKRVFDKLRLPEDAKHAHAQELLTRYSYRLDKDQIALLQAYKKLSAASFLEKMFLIFKYRLYKIGFLRNLVNLLLKRQ